MDCDNPTCGNVRGCCSSYSSLPWCERAFNDRFHLLIMWLQYCSIFFSNIEGFFFGWLFISNTRVQISILEVSLLSSYTHPFLCITVKLLAAPYRQHNTPIIISDEVIMFYCVSCWWHILIMMIDLKTMPELIYAWVIIKVKKHICRLLFLVPYFTYWVLITS